MWPYPSFQVPDIPATPTSAGSWQPVLDENLSADSWRPIALVALTDRVLPVVLDACRAMITAGLLFAPAHSLRADWRTDGSCIQAPR